MVADMEETTQTKIMLTVTLSLSSASKFWLDLFHVLKICEKPVFLLRLQKPLVSYKLIELC
jgi:hypothetical protein